MADSGFDPATLALIQDSYRTPGPVTVLPSWSAYPYLQQGFAIGNQIDKQNAEQQSLALAAAKSPYDIALLKAKADAIPYDRKYNQDLLRAQILRTNDQALDYQSKAEARERARNGGGVSTTSTADDILHDAGYGDPSAMNPSVPATLPDQNAGPTYDNTLFNSPTTNSQDAMAGLANQLGITQPGKYDGTLPQTPFSLYGQ